MTKVTETETVDRGVPWRQEAFQMAYQDHSGAVYAAARGFCGGSRVAEDVTVEVFLHLWRQPEPQDSARASLRTWLLTATHDFSGDTTRSETTRGASLERAADRPVADLKYADQYLVAAVGHPETAQSLEMLSCDERNAIVTAYYGGCTYREAAVALGVDEGTVKARIRAGLHHLRGALACT